jgi:hypothetical protein
MALLSNAGVAQLVERNLAKVEVESSRLFSRSRIQKGKLTRLPFFIGKIALLNIFQQCIRSQHCFDFAVTIRTRGGVAKWLCSGLQSRLRRFDPDPRLQFFKKALRRFFYCYLI